MNGYWYDMYGMEGLDLPPGIIPGLTDDHGRRATRTKMTHPYSYDPVVTWWAGQEEWDKTNDGAYHDRMQQWDYKKYEEIVTRIFRSGKGEWRNPKDIEQLIREYYGKPDLKLTMIVEYCNLASGYAVYRFDWIDPSLPPAKPKERPKTKKVMKVRK